MKDHLVLVAGVLFGLAMAVLLVVAARSSYKNYRKCVDNGGHFENRNCRTRETWECVMQNYSDGSCIAYGYRQHTTCDSVCIGASAEAQP